MSVGPDIAYSSGALRRGGAVAVSAADAAVVAAGALGGVEVVASVLGAVRGAPELAAALARARRSHIATCASVSGGHAELDAGARDVAAQGDRLDVDAAGIAASAVPR